MERAAPDIFGELAAQGAVIERLSSDSRRCAPGVAFFAYPGEAADGRDYIAQAAARGAAAVLWEPEGFAWPSGITLPNAAVPRLKARSGALAHHFYGAPSASLWTCGVTGTNGKTSCSQWIAALLGKRGVRTAVIGTLGAGFPGALEGATNTTPDALETHRLMRELLRAGARALAMEVSSHGLVQGRVNAVQFDCALFTNLSHDHLDYHGSMEAYEAAKAMLFEMPGLQAAVLNLDDVAGARLATKLTARGMRTIGYSLAEGAAAPGTVTQQLVAAAGEVRSGGEAAPLKLSQLGRFNISNALGVLGCLMAYGLEFREAAALLADLPPVPGRMEVVGGMANGCPLVVVDYAHTPDALEKVLHALRPVAKARGGRLVAVFGAGGDRDPSKRPVMGAIAARLADRVLLTSDNPRNEDPLAILAAIREGADGRAVSSEPDRGAAIERAIAEAGRQDVVLIAGKGHESYQEIAGRRLPFSDAAVARAALARRGGE